MNKKISFEFIVGLLILIITFVSFIYFALKIDYFDSSNKFNLNSKFFDIGGFIFGAVAILFFNKKNKPLPKSSKKNINPWDQS